MEYLLDANVFIQAKNQYYGMNFCPAFWNWLIRLNEGKKVYSIEKVEDELMAGDDELSLWTEERGSDFFLKPDERVIQALQTVTQWVSTQHYDLAAVNTFLQDADFYLVAHALSRKYVVVTHEKPSDGKHVKIPNVCIGLKIKFMSTFEMLKREKARFVLEA